MTSQRRFRTFLLFVSVIFLPAYGREASLNGFDDYVNKALREWEAPGFAIAIVKDDRVMRAKIEMAEGKVMSLTLVRGSGPSLVFIAEAIVRN